MAIAFTSGRNAIAILDYLKKEAKNGAIPSKYSLNLGKSMNLLKASIIFTTLTITATAMKVIAASDVGIHI